MEIASGFDRDGWAGLAVLRNRREHKRQNPMLTLAVDAEGTPWATVLRGDQVEKLEYLQAK